MQCRSPTLLPEILELQTVEQGKYEEEKRKENSKRWEARRIYIHESEAVRGAVTVIKPAEYLG